jgi:hypothetical protein
MLRAAAVQRGVLRCRYDAQAALCLAHLLGYFGILLQAYDTTVQVRRRAPLS